MTIETTLINIPTDKIKVVERILGKKIAENQVPYVRVRVPEKLVKKIRKEIRK